MATSVFKEHFSLLEQEYKVFVAGIPSTLKFRSLNKYFSMIGPITRIESMNKGKNGRYQNYSIPDQTCHKGYCVIVTQDLATYHSILNGSHELLGRALMCTKYLKKGELINHNQSVNQQRLLLKNVPPTLSESNLKKFLEDKYGSIRIIYAFKTQKTKGTQLTVRPNKNLTTYSVTFDDPQSALMLSKNGEFIGPNGCLISASPFKSYSKEHKKDPRSGTELNRQLNFNRVESDEEMHEKSQAYASDNIVSPDGWPKHWPGSMFPKSTSLEEIHINHHIKPTSRAYYINNKHRIVSKSNENTLNILNITLNLLKSMT